MRYAVYTMRRTSSRTVYAIYDTEEGLPVKRAFDGRPYTTTDRDLAKRLASKWDKDGAATFPEELRS